MQVFANVAVRAARFPYLELEILRRDSQGTCQYIPSLAFFSFFFFGRDVINPNDSMSEKLKLSRVKGNEPVLEYIGEFLANHLSNFSGPISRECEQSGVILTNPRLLARPSFG